MSAELRLGVITSGAFPDLVKDDQPFLAALPALGVRVVPLVWGAATLAAEVDAYLVRSPWDWYLRPDEFDAFLAALPETRTHNAPSLMRAYLGKDYLLAFAAAGIATVPTELVDGGHAEIGRAIARRDWSRSVVKPIRSAGAHRTICIDGGIAPPSLAPERWLVQRYLPEIERGELSFVFFDGELSHCVRKSPRAGDFRVQREHGGNSERHVPSAELVAQAARALSQLGPAPLYARVDGVVVDDELLLMELEVVEPELFFGLCAEAGPRFANALCKRLFR